MNTIHMAWPLLLAAAACAAQAEPATAPAAALKYESAFATYRAYREPQLASWQEINAKVAQSPGHGAHGVQGAASADPHAGHDMSKMKPADPHAGHGKAAPKAAAPASDPHKDHQH